MHLQALFSQDGLGTGLNIMVIVASLEVTLISHISHTFQSADANRPTLADFDAKVTISRDGL